MSTDRARGRWRSVAANAALIVVSLLVGLAMAEIGLRLAGIGYGNSPVEASRRLHHERPRNYEFIAYDPRGEFGGFPVTYDDQGHRVPEQAGPKPAPGGRRVAFLGDSFTEGYTSAWNDTFIGQLGRANPDIAVRNFGVASYAALMYLVQARQDLPAFKPTDVVLQLFVNDFDDDHMYLSRASSPDIDKVEWIDGGPRNTAIVVMRYSYLARLLRRGQVMLSYMVSPPAAVAGEGKAAQSHDLTLSIVAATRREAERQGARFYLMIVPDKGLADKNKCCAGDTLSREVASFAARDGITYVDLAAAFGAQPDQAGLYYRQDIHFTQAGNRLVADALARAMGLKAP